MLYKSLAFSAMFLALAGCSSLANSLPVSSVQSNNISSPSTMAVSNAPVSEVASTATNGSASVNTESLAKATVATPAPTMMRQTKKGISLWNFASASIETAAISDENVGWYYNWGVSASSMGVTLPGFVPMIWGSGTLTAANIQSLTTGAHAHRFDSLLGFNEPDQSGQANMTVAQAIHAWPQLQNIVSGTSVALGSPAVSWGADQTNSWLDQFMTQANAKHYKVDFICLHWYGSSTNATNDVNGLLGYVNAVYAKYHKPIWITEFSLIHFGSTSQPSVVTQQAFLSAITSKFNSPAYSFVQRYSWFSLPYVKGANVGLLDSSNHMNALGQTYKAIQ